MPLSLFPSAASPAAVSHKVSRLAGGALESQENNFRPSVRGEGGGGGVRFEDDDDTGVEGSGRQRMRTGL